ncbi:hypothetical protein GKZ89_12155 [Bacillus mangrovi]|uniref:Uncharacterized protein n=1 Tax=Metabacillus mangrovi TaxID=1491830 RepID=A0A7X2S677_9BACI|nr:hypothetical protein [Metabacillus mangrovi]MTH54157.1 hypothetical protein [Metabacillus mangrovi]
MIQMTVQSIKEHETESLNAIESCNVTEIKSIIGSSGFTNAEKVHLIESRLFIEKSEGNELAAEMSKLRAIETFFQSIACHHEERGEDAPNGPLTIFDFLGEEPEEDADEKDIPEGVQVAVSQFMGHLQALLTN